MCELSLPRDTRRRDLTQSKPLKVNWLTWSSQIWSYYRHSPTICINRSVCYSRPEPLITPHCDLIIRVTVLTHLSMTPGTFCEESMRNFEEIRGRASLKKVENKSLEARRPRRRLRLDQQSRFEEV
ncbi:hypothetical protein J6590_014181 [Homalodisca vitripennis]|nr:hypothetical protein J6590_014181 [Homalodisca vitripennis]